MNKQSNQANKKLDTYKRIGLISFTVLAGLLLLIFFLFKISAVKNVVLNVVIVLRPIIIGFAIAYIANPLMKFFEKYLKSFFINCLKFKNIGSKISRGFAIVLSLLVFCAVIAVLIYLIVPELYSSIMSLVETLPSKIDQAIIWITAFFEEHPQLSGVVTALLNFEKKLVETDLFGWVTSSAGTIASGVMKTGSFIFNIVIGAIVAIYILYSKEKFQAQFKKLCYAVSGSRIAEGIISVLRKSHEVFGGFISGQLIDAMLVGLICFIGSSLMNMPFAILVSVIVGTTNIIPVFGPYIGGIPSVLLITLVSPIKGLYFVIFILCLQVFDGYFLAPKILGDSIGLSSFWVVFAIVIGGGLFGVVGMIIGVPLFAVIYYLINEAVRYALKKRSLPLATDVYAGSVKIEPLTTPEESEIEKPEESVKGKTKPEEEEEMRKKELISKMNSLVENMNTLQHQLAAYREENASLKDRIEELNKKTTESSAVSSLSEKGDTGFSVTEVEEETTFENSLLKPSSDRVEEVDIITDIKYDKISEHAALAIGTIVKESAGFVNLISTSNSPDKKELLNLIMGRGEVAKSEIFGIAEGDAPEETKRDLIDNAVAETIDYFKSVAGQI